MGVSVYLTDLEFSFNQIRCFFLEGVCTDVDRIQISVSSASKFPAVTEAY